MTIRLDRMANLWQSGPEYAAYAAAQAEKTQRFQDKRLSRVPHLVGLAVRHMHPDSPVGKSVLAVGCRNTHELDCLWAAGFSPVTGIDLLSMNPQIRAMDMHVLDFPDHTFDAIFASHSLEHAYNVDRVLGEWARVVRPNGYWIIEVPLGFPPTAVDRHAFESAEALGHQCQARWPCWVLHAGTVPNPDLSPWLAPAGRVVLRGRE